MAVGKLEERTVMVSSANDQGSELPSSTAGDGWRPGQERLRNIARLQSFARLEPGWDGYDAEVVKPLPIMLGIIMQTAPAVVPLSTGGVQMEWHRDGWDIELEISPDGTALLEYQAPAVKPESGQVSEIADETK